MVNRTAGTFDSMVGTRRFSSHTPREPHQCPHTGGVVHSSVCGGRWLCESVFVAMVLRGRQSNVPVGSPAAEPAPRNVVPFQWVVTVRRSRPSRGIVDSRSHVEIMPPLAPWKIPRRVVSGSERYRTKLENDELCQIKAWILLFGSQNVVAQTSQHRQHWSR